MSSADTGDVINGSKLLVRVAENGHSLEVHCDESTLVEVVQQFIRSVSGIPSNDQLLLCLDMKLDPQSRLSDYKLPSEGQEVFVFNKMKLQPNASPPVPEYVDIVDEPDPPFPSPLHSHHHLDDAKDPALKALPSYERQFRYHYQLGHTIFSRTQVKFDKCQELLMETKVQERAVEVARANLEQFYRMVNQTYADVIRRYTQQYRYHSDLLMNFGRDLERLKSVQLHPAIQSTARKCLFDFVKEDNLPKWLENCSNSHKQLNIKISQFKKMFTDIRPKMEDLLCNKVDLPIRNMEFMLKDNTQYIDEVKNIMLSLSKDVTTVKKLVDDCLMSQMSSSLRPHDAVSALGPMYDVHDKNHLPRMQEIEGSTTKFLEFCKEKKNEMITYVHNYMQKIAYMSYVIKDAKLQFHVFKEAIRHQDDLFMNLRLVRGIGSAYRACLAEIVRRRASMKIYMGMAGQLVEKLAAKRDLEIRRRDEFLKMHGAYIPRDVLSLMGLYDAPNQCDVHIAPFDTNLLDIDISEVDRYAPQYLNSFFSGNKKHGNSGLFSMSNENFHLAEGDEAVSANADYCSEEQYGSSELVDITGTNKIEVENAKLKAELASAIALICSFGTDVEYDIPEDSKLESLVKNTAEKTAEALHLKDEYGKQLQSLLRAKEVQCMSYEKRIQELEQRLSDHSQKHAANVDNGLFTEADGARHEELGERETHMPYTFISEPMDEASCTSSPVCGKANLYNRQLDRNHYWFDENMSDLSGVLNPPFDPSTPEPHPEQLKAYDTDKVDVAVTDSPIIQAITETPKILVSEKGIQSGPDSSGSNEQVFDLKSVLSEKSNQLIEVESKLKTAMDEVTMLRRELIISQKLLDESQMNCAHLENCLHEAREEAQTHLCASDRRASEYNALRASAVKMRGIFGRLRSCITSSRVDGIADALRMLAHSLANSSNDGEDEGITELRICTQILSDKVGFLSNHRSELAGLYAKIEAANKELMSEKEMVKTLYTKNQLEKQANKEKMPFRKFKIHEIAAFMINSDGHYEAVNQSCPNYFLSAESVALFVDHLPTKPMYVIGQIVHIERRIARTQLEHMDQVSRLDLEAAMSNPYGLPAGCEYFIVTVAMLPDTSAPLSSPIVNT